MFNFGVIATALVIDSQTELWGIKVVLVEVKDIDLPQAAQRAMAKQAEAEREACKDHSRGGRISSLAEARRCG
jgi:regulator of protease activity HflC (stomatin/prohibitin superfamily)